MMKCTLLITFLCLFSFSALAAKLEIKSNPPEAELYVYSDSSSEPEKIGKTPFKADLQELIDTYVKKNIFILELRKDGFENYKILFTRNAESDISLSVNLEVSKKIATIKAHDTLMSRLFEVQRLIRAKNYGDAISKLDELEEKFPHFSIIAELKATAYYMNKDIEKSLSYYRRAFALNPDNVDAYKMKVYLEKKLGVYADIP
jgi:tetratricopeptide (TPR) repeat protein